MKFENRLGFYIVNIDYLEYLHKYDYEVQYNSEYKKKIKPHWVSLSKTKIIKHF